MKVTVPAIDGLLIFEPNVFRDERGYFFESFNAEVLKQHGLDTDFVQDNQSSSKQGVLRGLHFQKPPFAQGKLVRVVQGKVWDVAVDIRKNSPTYGQHVGVELSAENNLQFWIPPGFAHGFVALSDDTIFLYKCTNIYHRESESGMVWNDAGLNIPWPLPDPLVSTKDQQLPHFQDLETPF